eukprot:2620451-Rhodomonas_salina.1
MRAGREERRSAQERVEGERRRQEERQRQWEQGRARQEERRYAPSLPSRSVPLIRLKAQQSDAVRLTQSYTILILTQHQSDSVFVQRRAQAARGAERRSPARPPPRAPHHPCTHPHLALRPPALLALAGSQRAPRQRQRPLTVLPRPLPPLSRLSVLDPASAPALAGPGHAGHWHWQPEGGARAVSYTHLRAHETEADL